MSRPAAPSSSERSQRGAQLAAAMGATLVVKLSAIAAGLTLFAHARWVGLLERILGSWHALMLRARGGELPYVDFGDPRPVLSGALYGWLARAFDPGASSWPIAHAALMAGCDALNLALFYPLARAACPERALLATLLLGLSSSGLVLGPVQDASLVVTLLLAGYHAERRSLPLLAAMTWGVAAALHPFGWLAIAALALRRERDAGRALFVSFATWLLINAPFALLSFARHGNLDAWFAIFRGARAGADNSWAALAEVWLGQGAWRRSARLITLGILPLTAAATRRAALPGAIAALGLAAVALDRAYPPEWNLCVYPFLLLALAPSPRWRVGVLLFAMFDVCSTRAFPFDAARALRELGELAPGIAAQAGGWRSFVWSAAIAARTLLAALLMRELLWEVPLALRARQVAIALAAALLVSASLWTSDVTRDMRRYSDERTHVAQIDWFCHGDYRLHDGLTMLPGYHALAAVVGRALDDCSRPTLRALTTVFGLAAGAIAFPILIALGSRVPIARTLGFYALPLAFPYQFVAFTDVPALVAALLCVWCAVRERWAVAALFAALAILMRQTNVILPLLLIAVAWPERDPSAAWSHWVRRYALRAWPALVVLACFAAFVLINRGVALGDRGRHSLGFHVANAYFALGLLFCVGLPTNLARLWQERRRLAAPRFGLALLAAFAIYMLCFHADHDYNARPSCLHNLLLIWLRADPTHQALCFIPIAFGLATLWATPLVRPSYWALAPLSLTILLPESLVEPRYALVPIALWSLLRRDGPRVAESLSVLTNAALSALLVYSMLYGKAL